MRWFIRAILLTSIGQAQTVMVQGPHTSPLDYRAALKAHPDSLSPSDEYLKGHPLLVEREKLLNGFSEAQRAFLEKSIEEARQKFAAVADLFARDDWAKSDRDIFLQVFLRLAQLESDDSGRDRWLIRSLALGDDATYDSSLYPPPLLARREELRKSTQRREILRRSFAPEWKAILVNGVRCGKSSCGSWPVKAGRVRVTWLSDEWLPQSAVLEVSAAGKYEPKTVAWAEGACGQVQWNAQSHRFASKKVFWGMDCNPAELVAWNGVGEKPVETNLAPFASSQPPIPPPSPPFYQSKWLWIGVGAAAAAVLVYNSQKKETREPSTSYGY